MEIAYDIGPDDLIEYNLYLHMTPARRSERLKKSLGFSALVALPAIMLLDSPDRTMFAVACGLLAIAVITPLLTVFNTRGRLRRHFVRYFPRGENSALYGWRRMTIDAERILQEGELMVAGWKWPAVERIVVTDHLVLFFIAQSAALMVPRRAFADEAALRQFVETAERFHRAARRPT